MGGPCTILGGLGGVVPASIPLPGEVGEVPAASRFPGTFWGVPAPPFLRALGTLLPVVPRGDLGAPRTPSSGRVPEVPPPLCSGGSGGSPFGGVPVQHQQRRCRGAGGVPAGSGRGAPARGDPSSGQPPLGTGGTRGGQRGGQGTPKLQILAGRLGVPPPPAPPSIREGIRGGKGGVKGDPPSAPNPRGEQVLTGQNCKAVGEGKMRRFGESTGTPHTPIPHPHTGETGDAPRPSTGAAGGATSGI